MRKYFDLLGCRVKDKVTGYRGTVTSIQFFLNGCIQASVMTDCEKNGENKSWNIDFDRLNILKKSKFSKPTFQNLPGGEGAWNTESCPRVN